MHRWFRTRELLLGEMLAELGEQRMAALRRRFPGGGPQALLDTFDIFNHELAGSPGLRAFVTSEPELAVRVLTSSDGTVQPRMVAAVEALIEQEVRAGFRFPVAPDLLAYAIVRLCEAFLYSDLATGVATETDRLREVEAALLGLKL